MWEYEILDTESFAASLKKLQKRYPTEIEELFGRLCSFVEMLNSGLSIPQVRKRGWVHDKYKHDMLSLDAGGGKGRAKLRLYILPDDGRITVFVVGVGTKDAQSKDVKKAYELLEQHSNSDPEENHENKKI